MDKKINVGQRVSDLDKTINEALKKWHNDPHEVDYPFSDSPRETYTYKAAVSLVASKYAGRMEWRCDKDEFLAEVRRVAKMLGGDLRKQIFPPPPKPEPVPF
jgi:hypothetical protein